MKKLQTFEDFLSDKCDTHTNNDPAGFDRWLEQLDGSEYMDYAEEYGQKCYLDGKDFILSGLEPYINSLKEKFEIKS